MLIVGDERGGLGRVPTISFVVRGERPIRSKDVVEVFDKKGGVRFFLILLSALLRTAHPCCVRRADAYWCWSRGII